MYAYGTQRSAIPRVVGILCLVFAPIGALFSLGWVLGPLDTFHNFDSPDAWQPVASWLYAWGALSVAVFGVHLAAGILATMNKPSAPRWMTIYGAFALALAVADAILMATLRPSGGPHHRVLTEDFLYMHLVIAVLGSLWPVIALILMNTRGAKAACAQVKSQDIARVFT